MPELVLSGVPVRFPYEPYEVQKNYMSKLIESFQKGQNSILESPTGTGKTLCLLCASLAWLELKKVESSAKTIAGTNERSDSVINFITSQLQEAIGSLWKQVCPKIIYSSRTHSQLSQAIKELKKTSYSYTKVSVLGSRDQMCINPDVSNESNSYNKIHMCQARVKTRSCYFYNQVEHKKLDPELREKILDLEDIVKLGKKRCFCPYYMARELRQDADMIFLPYNYLLDPKSRRAHGIELQGNIVIFDEAHNVEKMCEESASLQIRSTDLALCIDEVTQVMKKLQELAQSELGLSEGGLIPEDFSVEDLYILKTIFLELEKAIDEVAVSNDGSGTTYPGEFMFSLLEKADITPNKKAIILDIIDKLVQYLTVSSTSPYQRKGAGLQKFSELIKIVFSKDNFTLSHMDFVKQCYKVHMSFEEKKKSNKAEGWVATKPSTISTKPGKVLSYWCFNPGFGMKDLAEQGVQCIVLTSGTLSPMSAFTSELQIPFPITLENPHIIKPCQVWVGAVCKGPDGIVLNSSYQNRSKPEYINSLGQSILTFSRVIPGGLLVFFPSYPILKMCQENWQMSGIWSRLTAIKPVYVEPQTKDGFLKAMEEFYGKVKDPTLKGACFMAVCRGKVSEGLDFADRNGRAVIITGLPFPPFKDPRVVLKQKYLEEVRPKTNGLTGSGWYRLEASRAVNQAVGRVIRHKDDFGAIILCDKRFGDASFRNELSSWIRPHLKLHQTFGPALRDLIQFFRITNAMFPESEISEMPKKSCPLKIEYESEPSTSKPVACAFERASGRLVSSNQVKGKDHWADSNGGGDPDAVYEPRPTKPLSAKKTASKQRNRSLFSALDKKTLILNFNSMAEGSESEDSRQDPVLDVPKRKKIKLVSRSKKDVTSEVADKEICGPSPSPDIFESVDSNCDIAAKKPSSASMSGNHDDRSSTKHAKIAKYIKEVKSVLSSEEYQHFSEAIKAYKTSSDCDTLIATILSLFAKEPRRYSLLLQFRIFLHQEHRIQLEAVHHDLITASRSQN